MAEHPANVLCFGEFRYRRGEGRLTVRGAVIPLQPQVATLLGILLSGPGRLHTHDELMDAVWPDTHVTQQSLTQLVRKLRRALDDDPKAPRFVETVVKRGYRFVHEVTGERVVAATPARTNLRPGPTPFIGRAGELDALAGMAGRLVTIVGTGGAGKTRLAREHGLRAAAGGTEVWFCDLSHCQGLSEVLAAVASVLDIPLVGREDPMSQVGRALAARGPAWVVLDNCEQVVSDVWAAVQQWFTLAPEARFLATSRAPVGLAGEVRFGLEPMAVDDGVALLCARANALVGSWAHSAGDLDAAAQVVDRLDRLPLAIELAAGWATVLRPAQLLERISADLLRDPHARLARHATLDSAIAWSWDLLAPWERQALVHSTVFRGGFALQAFEAVVAAPGPAPAPIAVLRALLDKSLVHTRPETGYAGEARFGLYGAIRSFAAARLADEAREAAEARHAAHYAAWAAEVTGGAAIAESVDVFSRLGPDQQNLQAAVARAAGPRPGLAAQAGVALLPLLRARGPQQAHEDMTEVVRQAAERSGDAGLHARALLLCGSLARDRGRYEGAEAAYAQVAKLAGQGGGARVAMRAQAEEWLIRIHQSREAELPADALEGAALEAQRTGDLGTQAVIVYCLGMVRRAQQEWGAAERHLARAATLSGEAGAVARQATALVARALVLDARGDPDTGVRLCEQALDLYRRIGARYGERTVLGNMGCLLHGMGRLDDALHALATAVTIADREATDRTLVYWLAYLALVHAELGDHERARVLIDRATAALPQQWGPIVFRRLVVETLAGDLDAASATRASLEVLPSPLDPHAEGLIGLGLGLLEATRARAGGEADLEVAHEALRRWRSGTGAHGYLGAVMARLVIARLETR